MLNIISLFIALFISVTMKVCILNMVGNFNKALGQGTQRTSFELWAHIKPLSVEQGIDIDRVEIGIPGSETIRKISFTAMMPLHSFSKYDIVHLLIPIPHVPRAGRHTKILTTVNEFGQFDKGSPAEKILAPPLAIKPKKDVKSLIMGHVNMSIADQIRKSDYMGVNSRQTLEEAVKWGYPRERIFIINHGVDERFLTKTPKKPKGGFRVGFIGALNPRKNISFAIEAFRHVKARDATFEIWGNRNSQYEALVEQAKGDPRIKFMGFAPEDAIVSIYDRFDAFAFPSVYEGFGLPIIEAQSRALPVILYKKGKIPQETRKHCFEAKDEKDMARIIDRLAKYGYGKKEQKAATDYARGFTRQKEALRTLEVYREIESRRQK